MATQKFLFDDAALEAIAPSPDGKQLRVFDVECRGLGLWVGGAGQKMFFAYRWTPDMPKPHEVKVGPFPDLSVDEARQRARSILAKMAKEAVQAAPAEEEMRPGECVKCKDMTMLNGKGLCVKCRPLPPCATHPEVISSARCISCSRAFCDQCLTAKQCAECAAKRPKRKAQGNVVQQRAKIAIDGVVKNRKVILAAAVGLFVLVQGGLYLKDMLDNQGPPATPEQHYAQRLGIALSGLRAFQSEKQRLPNDAKELGGYLKAKGGNPPVISGPGKPLPKNAIVYAKKGDGFDLFATTEAGEPDESSQKLLKAD